MPRFYLPDHLEPNFLLRAYAAGIFPMPDESGHINWYAPDPRAILEHDDLQVSRSLRTTLRKGIYNLRINTAFEAVMRGCAAPRGDDPVTWINEEFIAVYSMLHQHGFAHSVEAWQDEELVGGLYGVSIGGAFMGESMFSRRTDASKVCLVATVEHLKARGFILHDTQFRTPHLERMGVRLIPRDTYLRRLEAAVVLPCSFI